MFRIRFAANAVGFSYCIVAVFAALAISSASHATETTLARWDLSGKLSNQTSVSADAATLSQAFVSASLARGGAATSAGATAAGYGMKNLDDTSRTEGQYIEIAFVVADGWMVELQELSYAFSSTSNTGPTTNQWLYVVDAATETALTNEIPIAANGKQTTRKLDLTQMGQLEAGSSVAIRVYAWGASANTGTFVLKDPLTFSGTAVMTGTPDPVPLSVAVEDFGTIFAGVSSGVALTYVGDNAVLDISADTVIAGTTNYVNGVFSFTPDDADIGKTITFTATVSDSSGENPSVTDTFTATVVERPFLEGFEVCSTKTQYYTDPSVVIEGDITSWRGTNFLVNGSITDRRHGEHAVRFRGGYSCYVEMAVDKSGGAGEISFWHGKVSSDTTKTVGTNDVFVSRNHGLTWMKINNEPIIVTNDFEKATLTANVGGDIRVRIAYEGSKSATIDDILITDYDGPAIIEPAIGEIADRQCYDDESISFEVGFFGDDVAGTITNISATAGVASSEYSLVDGVFTFTPSEADLQINGGIIEFTITLSVPGRTTATRQFCVTVKAAPPRFLGIAPGMVLLEDFDSIGTDDTASLPAPWKVAHSNGDTPDYTLSYALASDSTTQRATNANGSISAFTNTGIYNLGTNDEDRAVGFVSGRSAYQTCALMVPVKNVSTETLSTLFVSYSVEKWRKGAGKRLALYSSMNGSAWTAIEGFETTTETDFSEGTTTDKSAYPLGEALVIDTKAGKFPLSQPVAPQGTFYLGWFYTRPGSSGNGTNGQCLGVDDVRIRFCGSDQTVLIMK